MGTTSRNTVTPIATTAPAIAPTPPSTMPSRPSVRSNCEGSVPMARKVPISRVRSMIAIAIALVTTNTTISPMIMPKAPKMRLYRSFTDL